MRWILGKVFTCENKVEQARRRAAALLGFSVLLLSEGVLTVTQQHLPALGLTYVALALIQPTRLVRQYAAGHRERV